MLVIKFVLNASLIALAYCLTILGLDWMEIGHGLNPWIAFPLAFIITVGVSYNICLGIYNEHRMHMQQFDHFIEQCASFHPPHPEEPSGFREAARQQRQQNIRDLPM